MVTIGRYVPLPFTLHRVTTYCCVDSRQVSDLDYRRIRCLTFAPSAPGESSLPPLNAHGASDVRHDVRTRAIISEVRREVTDLRREVLKTQEGAGSQHRSVSVTPTPSPDADLPLYRPGIGQRSRLLLGPATYTCIQCTWGITTPTPKELLRT